VAELGNYVPSIDNMSSDVKDVHSLVVSPIWGHANGGDVKSNSQKPVGIIQFINKNNYDDITAYDLAKIKSMQGLLGKSIENIMEHHSVINCRLSIQETMSQV